MSIGGVGGDETQAMGTGRDPTQAMGTGADATQAMGGGPTDTGGPPARGGDDGDRRRMWMIALGVLLVGAIVGAGIALAVSGGGGNETAATTSTSTSPSTSTSASTTTTPTTQPPTTTTKSNNTTTTTKPNNAPVISSLTTNPASKTCALESDSFSVTVSWNTSNTNQNVLSVDGPGAYGTYPGGSGSQALTPGCPPKGTSQQHTYTLTAKGPGGQVQKTITFSVNTVP
jgi:hypothetical protein